MEVFTRSSEANSDKDRPGAIPVRAPGKPVPAQGDAIAIVDRLHRRSASPKDAKVYVIHQHCPQTENNNT
jgi:hypothetical protein